MCGRYQLKARPRDLADAFDAEIVPELLDMPPRYNIAPTQPVPVVRVDREGRRHLVLMHWGLIPSWAKDASIGNRMINARSEGAATKPAFRAAMKYRRCLVPATGFYEWKRNESPKGRKQPFHIHLATGEPLAFAGLWEHWQDPAGNEIDSCTILTTSANGTITPIHNRMPVILPREAQATWLDHSVKDVAGLLRPFELGELVTIPLSPYVSNPRNEGPACIEPLTLPAAAGEDGGGFTLS